MAVGDLDRHDRCAAAPGRSTAEVERHVLSTHVGSEPSGREWMVLILVSRSTSLTWRAERASYADRHDGTAVRSQP